MSGLDYFSATVIEADLKFAAACKKHGVKPQYFRNAKCGPDGEALNIGVCRVGAANAKNQLLIISGTHGLEGFAGAGIQTGWLDLYGGDALPADTSLVIVHMINPWGMAWDRRENEDNVDLFRNFIYCDHPSVPDPLFDLVDDTIDLENWHLRDASRRKAINQLVAKHGMDRLIAVVRRGQHHRDKSLSYHGQGPTWSKSCLDQIISEQMNDAQRIAIIDIHTGFGDYGYGTVMSYDPLGSDRHSRVSQWFSGEIYTPGSDADIPDHTAQLPYHWAEAVAGGATVTAEILEFGTFEPSTIAESTHATHHFHIFGDPLSAEGQKWGKVFRHFFYPEEDEWKQLVWQRGCDVIGTTLTGLRQWGLEADD